MGVWVRSMSWQSSSVSRFLSCLEREDYEMYKRSAAFVKLRISQRTSKHWIIWVVMGKSPLQNKNAGRGRFG